MNKILKRIVFITLIVIIFISSVLAINVYATSTEVYDSCADYYFSNLKGNDIPLNAVGSCAYVSMATFLSYYNVYWNDYFIADKYENDATVDSMSGDFISSTLKTENLLWKQTYEEYEINGGALEENEYAELYYPDFVESNRNDEFLHLDLIGIGIDIGYYDGIFQNEEYASTLDETAIILDVYFDSIFGNYIYFDPLNLNSVAGANPPIKIKVLKSSALGTSHSEVVEKMYELLNESIPVMYRGSDGTTGHRMIAYDAIKDDNGNIVDCKLHTGLIGEELTTLSATEYDEDIAILWIEIDETRIPHRCSNNYVIGNERYCSCQVYGDLHPEHIHEPTETCYMYTSEYHAVKCLWDTAGVIEDHKIENFKVLSSDTHKEYCFCGYGYEEEHSVSWWQRSDTNHTSICECGYRYTEPHNFIEQDYHTSVCADCGETVTTPHESEVYEQLSATQHLVVCGCGYEGEAPHIFTCVSISASMHRMTCVCGYTTLDIHNFSSSATNPRYQTCTACGYTRDNFGPGGGNVIMGKEEDEETE